MVPRKLRVTKKEALIEKIEELAEELEYNAPTLDRSYYMILWELQDNIRDMKKAIFESLDGGN